MTAIEIMKLYFDKMEDLDRAFPHNPNPDGRKPVHPPTGRASLTGRKAWAAKARQIKEERERALGGMVVTRQEKREADFWHDRELGHCECFTCTEYRGGNGSS